MNADLGTTDHMEKMSSQVNTRYLSHDGCGNSEVVCYLGTVLSRDLRQIAYTLWA